MPIHWSELKPRRVIIADNGFDCLHNKERCVIQADAEGRVFVKCKDGQHFLDGQLDFDGGDFIVGFSRPRSIPSGFETLTPQRQREIAAKGGRALAPTARTFSTNRELAISAGRKGGQAKGSAK